MSTFAQAVMKGPWKTQGKGKMTPALLAIRGSLLLSVSPMRKPSMPRSLRRSSCCTRKQKQKEAQEATREEGSILSFILWRNDGAKVFWALKRKLRSPFLYPCSPIQELGPFPSDGEGQEKKKCKVQDTSWLGKGKCKMVYCSSQCT